MAIVAAVEQTRIWVSRTLPTPAPVLFSILARPRGHVAIDGSGMLRGADTENPVTRVGDTFVMRMDGRGTPKAPQQEYDMVVYIEVFSRDREIAWTVGPVGGPKIGHLFGYTLTPENADSTTVTTYYDWSKLNPDSRLATQLSFPLLGADTLTATLAALAANGTEQRRLLVDRRQKRQ